MIKPSMEYGEFGICERMHRVLTYIFNVFFSPDVVSVHNPNDPADKDQYQNKMEYEVLRCGRCMGDCIRDRSQIDCPILQINIFKDDIGLLEYVHH